MASHPSLTSVLRRDRILTSAGLVGLILISWVYLFYQAWQMQSMNLETAMETSLTPLPSWGILDFLLTLAMWLVMMIGMMLPSAMPMILLFGNINRQRRIRKSPFVPTTIFLVGYLVAWGGFSLLATIGQWGLRSAALLSPTLVSTSPILGGSLLLAAGVYQWTPLKHRCLVHCRSPLEFLMARWQEGTWGALRMGFWHGCYCVGCCWVLMGLLFVLGVMNLVWIAAIAIVVLIEKNFFQGIRLSRLTGLLLIGWGTWMIAG